MSSPFVRQVLRSGGASAAASRAAASVATAAPTAAQCRRRFVSLVSSAGGPRGQTIPAVESFRSVRSGELAASQSWYRYLSTEEEKKEEAEKAETPTNGNGGEEQPSSEEAAAAEDEAKEESKEEQLQKEIKDLKDQLLRSLAEQENTRAIAKRDVASARSFAVTSFAKSLLDTSDNLSRAMESVPEEYRNDTENHPVLATLYEGIAMTDDNLLKAFSKNGLIKYGKVGDKFDPNLHDALFEYPDPKGEVGTIGQVMKAGFKLNERVIRPAEVGVIKKE